MEPSARPESMGRDMRESTGVSLTNDTIELRLPLKSEYLPVLRATTGVVAGVASFDYEEITQLRVAVSEVFDLAIKHVTLAGRISQVDELTVRFSVHPDKIEIAITGPKDYTSYLGRDEGKESLALLESLMDEVVSGTEGVGRSLLRMVKYKSSKG